MLHNALEMSPMLIPPLACWFLWGATPGNLLTGTRIVDARTRGRPSVWQLTVRLLPLVLFIVPFTIEPVDDQWQAVRDQAGWLTGPLLIGVPVSYLMLAFDRDRRAWHDRLARTVVVGLPATWTPGKWWKDVIPPVALLLIAVTVAHHWIVNLPCTAALVAWIRRTSRACWEHPAPSR